MRLRYLLPSLACLAVAMGTPLPRAGPEGCASQQAWKTIQAHLPPAYRLNDTTLPAEEWWSWDGHDVHLDRFANADAPAKVILFHGVGTNGRQMSTILGHPLSAHAETVAVDMPLYGVTKVAPGKVVGYEDWVAAGAALVDAELAHDGRPVVLYGLSAGGMLAYHVAAASGSHKIKGIVGMTFLDQRIRSVRDTTALIPPIAQFGYPIAGAAAGIGFGALRIPMAVVSKMWALVNDPAALKDMLLDMTSAGNSVPLKFLSTYANYVPKVEPEEFALCPILLTQPEKDRWTPLALSETTLDKIKKVDVTKKTLTGAGHYPVEEEGLRLLNEYVRDFVKQVAGEEA